MWEYFANSVHLKYGPIRKVDFGGRFLIMPPFLSCQISDGLNSTKLSPSIKATITDSDCPFGIFKFFLIRSLL
jgi:hypothetical protein